jgi:hypothetical protein
VEMDPDSLARAVRGALADAAGDEMRVMIDRWQCFSPGRPSPTYRYSSTEG